jgi:hypothetical protein
VEADYQPPERSPHTLFATFAIRVFISDHAPKRYRYLRRVLD